MVWLWLQMRGRLLANASNEETEGEWGEWDGGWCWVLALISYV